jgi:hypothetical protein
MLTRISTHTTPVKAIHHVITVFQIPPSYSLSPCPPSKPKTTQEHPELLADVMKAMEMRLDHARVVDMFRKEKSLPLIKEYLLNVQKTNILEVRGLHTAVSVVVAFMQRFCTWLAQSAGSAMQLPGGAWSAYVWHSVLHLPGALCLLVPFAGVGGRGSRARLWALTRPCSCLLPTSCESGNCLGASGYTDLCAVLLGARCGCNCMGLVAGAMLSSVSGATKSLSLLASSTGVSSVQLPNRPSGFIVTLTQNLAVRPLPGGGGSGDVGAC